MKIAKLFARTGLIFFCVLFASLSLPIKVGAIRSDHCAGAAQMGRAGCLGYYTNTDFYDAGTESVPGWDILIDGTNNQNGVFPASVNSANSFINFIENYLNNGSPTNYDYNSVGAAFIVDTMLGVRGGDLCPLQAGFTRFNNPCTWQDGVRYAQSHLTGPTGWEARVQFYASQPSGGPGWDGWIEWDTSTFLPQYTIDSSHACGVGNTQTIDCGPAPDHKDLVFRKNQSAVTADLIIFHNPDGSVFRIRRDCANLVGPLEGLTLPQPPQCVSVTVDPGRPDPSTPLTITAVVDYHDVAAATTILGRGAMSMQVTGPGVGYNNPSVPKSQNGTVITGKGTAPAQGAAGTYTITVHVSQVDNIPAVDCPPQQITIAAQPYFSVDGGDVSAGASMGVGGTECATPQDDNGSVVGWNQEAPNYSGAGTQYAAFALNYLQDFATAQTTGIHPIGLSFSNNAQAHELISGGGADTYGGAIGSEPCIPDYYSQHPTIATYPPGQHIFNGNNEIGAAGIYKREFIDGDLLLNNRNGITVKDGGHTIIYVKGNVYIAGDILYSGGPYGSTQDIPSFTIIAQGNIYVDNNVSELDGWYIAEPSSATSTTDGFFYDCSTGVGDPGPFGTRQLKSGCNNQLKIYGSVVARQVWLERTFGSLYSANRAERIFFTPEMWLANPLADPSANTTYDAITTLPPSL